MFVDVNVFVCCTITDIMYVHYSTQKWGAVTGSMWKVLFQVAFNNSYERLSPSSLCELEIQRPEAVANQVK